MLWTQKPVSSYHIPLGKDVLEKDFKVFLSKRKSHLESVSQNEKQVIGFEREVNLKSSEGGSKSEFM